MYRLVLPEWVTIWLQRLKNAAILGSILVVLQIVLLGLQFWLATSMHTAVSESSSLQDQENLINLFMVIQRFSTVAHLLLTFLFALLLGRVMVSRGKTIAETYRFGWTLAFGQALFALPLVLIFTFLLLNQPWFTDAFQSPCVDITQINTFCTEEIIDVLPDEGLKTALLVVAGNFLGMCWMGSSLGAWLQQRRQAKLARRLR